MKSFQLPQSVVELTQTLVRIPSVNPDGESGSEYVGELACAQYIGEYLKALGAEVVFEEVLPGRPNVWGRFKSQGENLPKILFAPHSDTVSVTGMVVDPFGGELKDGKIYGRGTTDTKGPMASMLWALKENRDILDQLGVEIHFVAFMSEESSQWGSRDFVSRRSDYALALVGEPTDLKVVYKHKGCVWVDIITRGKSVHASIPEQGENAIVKMAKVILQLEGSFRQRLKEEEDSCLGVSTINVAMINGGTRSNIVPEYCQLRVDMRIIPELQAKVDVIELMKEFLAGEEVEIRLVSEAMALNTSLENPWIQKLFEVGSEAVGAPWFCDAAFLAKGGVPAIAIGPGSIEQAHTRDEWIKVEDLEKGVQFFSEYIQKLKKEEL
jgi:acetylornithine deacetylase/succinyl-diaminopimelate desuccinylase family protein